MKRSLALFGTLIGACSLMGFGCRNRPLQNYLVPGQASAPSAPIISTVPYIKKSTGDKKASPEIVLLRQVLSNLAKASSYHSHINSPMNNGNITAELFYSTQNGIQAVLHTDGGDSQLYVHGPAVFVKYVTSTWQDVSHSDEGTSARTQLNQSLLVNTDGTSKLLLRDSAKVLSTTEDPSGCKLYVVEQKYYSPTTITQHFEICVQNTYPIRIKSVSADGTVEITYDHFNDPSILSTPPNQS